MTKHDAMEILPGHDAAARLAAQARSEKDQNTGTPEPYYGKTLFQGFAVFDGHDFIPFGSFHRLPIFWDGRLNAFGHKDVTARYALWEEE